MSLYYLQGTPDLDKGRVRRRWPQDGILLCGLLLLIVLAILQAAGCFWSVERSLIHLLPKNWRPESSRTILLQTERGETGFKALDVAMALRGLAQLHPAQIVIDGLISPDQEAMPLLPDLLARIKEEKILVIQPESPSPEAEYRPIPLCSYNPPACMGLPSSLQTLPGSLSNKEMGTFLPAPGTAPDISLQLLAETRYGEVISSLWWPALTSVITTTQASMSPIWLLAGRLLILPNHSTLFLDGKGNAQPLQREQACMESLDDFLLQMEQKERGTLSPGFDALWSNSTVILGTADDMDRIALLSSLRDRIFWMRLPLLLQGAILFVWIALILGARKLKPLLRGCLAGMLMIGTAGASLLAIRHGLILPFLPPLITTLLLLIPVGFGKSK